MPSSGLPNSWRMEGPRAALCSCGTRREVKSWNKTSAASGPELSCGQEEVAPRLGCGGGLRGAPERSRAGASRGCRDGAFSIPCQGCCLQPWDLLPDKVEAVL